jgi:hypothetical protein
MSLHCSSCRGEEKFVWCILAVNFDLLNSIEIITVIAGAGIRFDLNYFLGSGFSLNFLVHIEGLYTGTSFFEKLYIWGALYQTCSLHSLTVLQCLLQSEFQISFYARNYLCLIFRLRNSLYPYSRKFVDISCLNDGCVECFAYIEFQTSNFTWRVAGNLI